MMMRSAWNTCNAKPSTRAMPRRFIALCSARRYPVTGGGCSLKKQVADHGAAHTRLVAEIRLALGREKDLVLWPLRQGTATPRGGAHPVPFGLVPGASDLLGILAPHGKWFALEAKTGHARQSPEQVAFANVVRSHGGVYEVVRSVEEAIAALTRAREAHR